MSTFGVEPRGLLTKSALIVGVGGLGCPAAMALVQAGIGRIVLADDDIVDESNLHRQLLYDELDVGQDKLDVAHRALLARQPSVVVELVRSRLLPDNARSLVSSVDVVVEGSDNFATKFLAADACRLERRPIVHGAAVRWTATVWAVAAEGRPCYRCLFEDVPGAAAGLNCAEAGVVGPVVGLAGALMAEQALRVLARTDPAYGRIYTYDGRPDELRQVEVPARNTCPLCGPQQEIFDIVESRYTAPGCAA